MADEPAVRQGGANLQRLREEIIDCYRGVNRSPLYAALHHTIKSCQLPRKYILEIIEGMESDLNFKGFDNFSQLRDYCYKVASAVGLLCIEIFGYESDKVREYAENLGIALQLTNIIRDVKEDLGRGRIYLPREEIAQCGLSCEDLSGWRGDGFISLMEAQYHRAAEYYRRAEAVLPAEERRNQMASEIMRAIYWALLEKMRAGNFPVLERRVALSGWRKVQIALSTYMKIMLS